MWIFSSTIIQISIFLGAIVVIWKAVVFLHHRAMFTFSFFRDVATIAEEFRPNGGISIKDKVGRIDANVRLLRALTFAFQEDADHGILVTDGEGLVVYTNRTLLHWHGRSTEETHGNGWINVIAPNDRDRVMEQWEEAVRLETNYNISFHLITAGGSLLAVDAHTYAMKVDGEVLGWVSTIKRVYGG